MEYYVSAESTSVAGRRADLEAVSSRSHITGKARHFYPLDTRLVISE